MMKRRQVVAAVAFTLASFFGIATLGDARAAGLFVSDRGVRPLGRGGAFVAGADDLGAIWYNPAGIADTPSSVLLDGSWVHYQDTFARRGLAPSTSGAAFETSFPTVAGTTPFLPIPTIAGSLRFGAEKQFAAALGIYAPDAALLSYPATIGGGVSAPQRYSLISLSGSILAVVGGWFAYKPVESIRLGVGVQMLTGYLKTTIDLSACPPDNLVCAPEDPNYAALTSLNAGPILAPSANVGVTWVPDHRVRIGVSGQAPFVIDAPTTVNVRLPSAPEFDDASQHGSSAHFHLEFPPILRAGVELRPLESDDLRIELAYVREFWSVQKSLDITPDHIQLYNITGFPSPFNINTISIPRVMKDSDSIRLGFEYRPSIAKRHLVARAGVSYETSALPTAYESPLAIDNNKVEASIGGSIVINDHLRVDGVLSHTFQGDVQLAAADARVPVSNPVNGNPVFQDYVNGGTYHVDLWIIGAGLEYRF
jgi:long-chain fatty acid transport protein